jgi:hypothetical protein
MSQGDWEKLNKEQQNDVNVWRSHISEMLIVETEAFYQQHPELRLVWSFTSEPLIRADNPVVFKEL